MFELVSEEECPLERVAVPSQDGVAGTGVARSPRGQGPFPAVLMLHGGLDPLPLEVLEAILLRGWIANRLLDSGYVTVLCTHRPLPDDPEKPEALWDCLAFLEYVRARSDVDAERVVLFGSSGGSDLALELATRVSVAAVMAEEPATTLFVGVLTRNTPRAGATWTPREAWPDDAEARFGGELQRALREKTRRIACPVRISQGDQRLEGADQLALLNRVLIPELRSAGIDLEEQVLPGQTHGFGFIAGVAPEKPSEETARGVAELFSGMDAFLRRHLARG